MAIRNAFASVEKIAFATFRRGRWVVRPSPSRRETKMYFRMCIPVNRRLYPSITISRFPLWTIIQAAHAFLCDNFYVHYVSEKNADQTEEKRKRRLYEKDLSRYRFWLSEIWNRKSFLASSNFMYVRTPFIWRKCIYWSYWSYQFYWSVSILAPK